MAVAQLELEGIGTVSIHRKRGLRSIRVTVNGDGSIRVSAPLLVPQSKILDFLYSKQDWITAHTSNAKVTILENAQSIGKEHTLHFVIAFSIDEPRGSIKQNNIIIRHPATMKYDDMNVQKVALKQCVTALRREAEQHLPGRVRDIAERMRFDYRSVSVKKLKGRWGSCDQDKNIILNLYLMQLDWSLIDYVIMHELIHTKHMNHGQEFWTDFQHFEPKAKLLRAQIKAQQPIISLPQA